MRRPGRVLEVLNVRRTGEVYCKMRRTAYRCCKMSRTGGSSYSKVRRTWEVLAVRFGGHGEYTVR